jgi:FkbM family methyltransferase
MMQHPTQRPIAFVLAATHQGTLLVNRHDYRITEHGEYGVGCQLLGTSSFDPSEVNTVLQLLTYRHRYFGDGVVALDCGANLGVHTIEWAKHIHPWGQVLAFEAQERVFYALAGNIAMNNCFNARAIWAAVGAQAGQIGVPIPDYCKPASFGSLEIRPKPNTEFIGQSIDYSKTNPTNMIAIDDLNLRRLDFIKIDIEGMEMEALLGAASSIERHRPQMLIEKIKSDESEITEFLIDAGYQLIPLGINILAIHLSDPIRNHLKIAEEQAV